MKEIARREGVDPLDPDQRLDDVLDPDALDQLFASKQNGAPRQGGKVEFMCCSYEVRIESQNQVTIERQR